jgi:hypothetical protein
MLVRKVRPGPILAKVHATSSKQMVHVFFNATYYVPRPETVELCLENALVYTAASVQKFLAVKGVEMICHPLFTTDLTPADYYFYSRR